MALKALLDSTEGLPGDVAKEYKKRDDGKFVLDVEATPDGDNGPLELAAVTKLRKALESERSNVQKANAKVQEFKDIDPKAARDAISKVEEMKNWKPETEVENRIKLIKDEITQATGKEKLALETKLKRAEGQLKKTLVTNVAVTAIQKAGGKVNLLLPHVERSIRMREQADNADNPYLAEIINPETGDVRVGDGSGITIDQLIQEFKTNDDFAPAFSASGASGTGAAGSGNKGGNNSTQRTTKVNAGVVSGMSIEDIAAGKHVVTVDD